MVIIKKGERMDMSFVKKNYVQIAAGALLLLLAGTSGIGLYIGAKQNTGLIIASDVERLAHILMDIHASCAIIDFDNQQNSINFLNVKSFSGSEVGPMNLTYPHKWQGPYLTDNPTMHEKEYMVVKTQKGYFITPGNGVKLPNGQVIGTDLILNEYADIPHLITSGMLSYNNKALAVALPIH